MAPSESSTLTITILILYTLTQTSEALFLTFVNNCPFTVYPAILPNNGFPVLEKGGFPLSTFTHRSFPVPNQHWAGRIWGRTGCNHSNGKFYCSTGDCNGRIECNGVGGATPATLVQLSLHHGHADFSSYSVSLVDGFNLPLTVTPHEGKGQCPVVGCKADLLATCMPELQVRHPAGHGPVVACKSGCEAYRTDELCCRNHYNSPQTCKPSRFSEFFKHSCPATATYAHDSPSLQHQCSSPRELKVIFCH
ncbi:Pathogenesis-related thaumatin superfamily protein [Euphorbia peplus]|nr:Pathogenesis-related thaumatin superfamily protein [Euphorbia peplus]